MKGSFLVAVLSVIVLQAAAEYGQWSEYGECMCDLKRYRSRVCMEEPCLGDNEESQYCYCAPLNAAAECPMVSGADSLHGLLADPCDCKNYYQCEYNTTISEFIAYQRRCNPCEIWDQVVLTCVRDPKMGSCTFFPSTEATGECPLRVVDDNPKQFMLGNETMDCAPGTTFNLTVCTCVRIVPYFPEMEEITSVTFDGGAITANMGLWLFNQNVEQISKDCMFGKCGFFNSSAKSKLELAYFSNALDRFQSFSVSLFFKRSAGITGTRSLVDNSECDVDGSVVAESSVDEVSGYFANMTGSKVDYRDIDAADGSWNHLVMSYDGENATIYMNKSLINSSRFAGPLNRVKASLVFGGCTCGGDCYFDGYMDSICFLKGGLTQRGVDYLYDNPNECLPMP